MGSGRWDATTYAVTTASARAAGTNFAYSSSTRSAPVEDWKVHETLDPKLVNKNGPFADKNIRSCEDSADHPNAQPIAVLFDVTGSMRRIPDTLQGKLPNLLGLLLRKGYVEDPQLLFGAIGDATCDRVPLQVGQFESDNRLDENLENLFLEGGGGGQRTESYELAAYFMARHTHLDSLEKRGKKGYLFIIGDEQPYAKVRKDHVERFIGGELQEDMSTQEIFTELQEKYEVYFLFATQGSYRAEEIVSGKTTGGLAWRELLGQNALVLDDADAVCETIALTIGLAEGTIDLTEGAEHLKEVGTSTDIVAAVTDTLAHVGKGAGIVATGDTPVELDPASAGTERL